MTTTHETPVLIVGAGPAGLIAALQLARHGTKCTLVERNLDTTKWPKMDITNCRSMELLRRLGVADGLREVGVAQDHSFDVLVSTGLSEGGELVAKWDLPSPNEWRKRIKQQNNGSMPREPYQRCSQAIFEAWLKPKIQAEPLIDSYFGMKFESLVESADSVTCTLTETASGVTHTVKSAYVIACDGAGSRVRRAIGVNLTGGPTPVAMYLVHFKSKDLTRIHKQGQFWHIFFTSGGVIISQDEVDTWTTHLPVPLDTDIKSLDPERQIQQVLGGSLSPYPIKVDEILVTSAWRPNRSAGGRIFLSGDSAHQNIPTGGYGMNTALGDSFDIGWKLSSMIKGYGGPCLLDSYERERRPVAARNIERSGVHMAVHRAYYAMVAEAGEGVVTAQTDEGKNLRRKIAEHVKEHDGENKDHGIEMGYRYTGSPVIVHDQGSTEPEWNAAHYISSTWPGARAPQVLLADGATSIFDLFGPEYTFIDFTPNGHLSQQFAVKAAELNIPLKIVNLPQESHAHQIWGRDAFLIRPDDHVAWRASVNGDVIPGVERVLLVSVGRESMALERNGTGNSEVASAWIKQRGFTATVGNVDQEKIEMLAAFQQ